MEKLDKFIPFCKIDVAKREVWGIVTAEVTDKDNETCHYATTVPYYRSLVDEMSKATDGKNIFPLREMHQLSAVGKGIGVDFRDDAKEIYMGFKVVDEAAWQKCAQSVYTGFSQGGSYKKKWDEAGKTYYTAEPSEASLVDNPCLGVAHFAYVKADGSVEMRKVRDYPLDPAVLAKTEEFVDFHKKLDHITELIRDTRIPVGEDKKSTKSEAPKLLTPVAAKSQKGVTTMTKTAKASLKDHFGKAAEYHKSMAKEDGDMEEAMKTCTGAPEGFGKMADCYKNMATAHSSYAEHLGKMAADCDGDDDVKKDDMEEAAKAAVAAAAATAAKAAPTVDLAKTVTDAVTAAVTAAMAKSAPAPVVEEKKVEPVQQDLTKAIGDAFAGLKLDDMVKAAVEANFAKRLEAPPQGFHLFQKANGNGTFEKVTSETDCGI